LLERGIAAGPLDFSIPSPYGLKQAGQVQGLLLLSLLMTIVMMMVMTMTMRL
jgi:hypothetical protein